MLNLYVTECWSRASSYVISKEALPKEYVPPIKGLATYLYLRCAAVKGTSNDREKRERATLIRRHSQISHFFVHFYSTARYSCICIAYYRIDSFLWFSRVGYARAWPFRLPLSQPTWSICVRTFLSFGIYLYNYIYFYNYHLLSSRAILSTW